MPKCVVTAEIKAPKWTRPNTPLSDSLIYEAHVKGLTQLRPDISDQDRGRFSGLATPQIVSHLRKIGVTALELLPAQFFHTEPRLTKLGLTNYWGYNPVNFFVPHSAYGTIKDIQKAVRALHADNIEVIVDVVYNHTAESDELGPTLSYRGIDNASYYHLLDDKRFYRNETGTGNALKMSHAAVLDLTLQSLRYWVEHMGVDGFRFDLATTLIRNPDQFDRESPFLTRIQSDPVLSQVKLIAEPWDIGDHGYRVGDFPKGWSEWNDQYRDDVRSYWKGAPNAHQGLAARLLGSADQFDHSNRTPQAGINLITAHDGFTLHDTVSYNHKHNHANGEQNRDGHGHNISDNMGVEGPTDNPDIIARRSQRKKNMLATLILSQGVPMLLAGDEFGQTQHGNNNGYCQDNETTWLNWADRDVDLEDFTAQLTALRQRFPQLTQTRFLHGEQLSDGDVGRNIIWLMPDGSDRTAGDWENPDNDFLAYVLNDESAGAVCLVFNRGHAREFPLLSDDDWTLELSTVALDGLHRIPPLSVTVFSNPNGYVTPDDRLKQTFEQAKAYGFVQQFRDINGHVHHAEPELLAEFLSHVDQTPPYTDLPETTQIEPVFGANFLQNNKGIWGVTCGLYGLHSDRSWGIGDFEDLAKLAEILAKHGADFVGINPVHDLFPSAPHLYSPYSPSSREFLNIMHIAPDKIPEYDGARPQVFNQNTPDELINYEKVYRAKKTAFETAFSYFQNLADNSPRQKAFAKFRKDRGIALEQHALFCVLFERLPASEKSYDGWKAFPARYHDPDSAACQKFAKSQAERVTYYAWLQWIAFEQLSEAQKRAKAAGMRIGLYLDMAVGVVPGGSDIWRQQDMFVEGVSLGAPGDMANPDGQMWDLLPLNPHAMARVDYAPFRRALRATMSLAGAVRIDHVLGLFRSFWISKTNGKGAYLHYPWQALTEIISDLSNDLNCIVIGEDLGTIPDALREKMAELSMIGCDIYLAHRNPHGDFEAIEDMRKLALAAYTNHDFPTLSGFWETEDLHIRERLGIGAAMDVLTYEHERRAHDKTQLSHRVGLEDVPHHLSGADMAKLQAYLAAGPNLLFAITLEDLTLDTRQPNVPGTTDEHPNWRLKAKLSLEDLAQDETAQTIMSAIDHAIRNTN